MQNQTCRKVMAKLAAIAAFGVWLGLSGSPAWAESDKYRLVWTDAPATTMTIGWCQVSGDPVGVKYGTDSSLATYGTNSAITTRDYNNSVHPDGPPLESHFVTLTGLEPETAYYFTVTDSEGDDAGAVYIGEGSWGAPWEQPCLQQEAIPLSPAAT